MAAFLDLIITTGAKKNIFNGTIENITKIKLNATPSKGAANKVLISFLAKTFDIKPSDISIVSGKFSKRKIIKFDNLEKEELDILLKNINT